MSRITTLAMLTLAFLSPRLLFAQSKWSVYPVNQGYSYVKVPIFAPIKEDPALPRVLLIGDSISMYYTPEVRLLLQGKANVYRIPDNGETTQYGLLRLDYWLGEGNWAVIHFNFGLHDLARTPNGGQQIPLAKYEHNLGLIVSRLQATHARLIWASTTPVPPGAHRRIEPDVIDYNAAARKIMDENRIPVNDLHAFVLAQKDREKLQPPADVHFRAEGSVLLAEEVARQIQGALGK